MKMFVRNLKLDPIIEDSEGQIPRLLNNSMRRTLINNSYIQSIKCKEIKNEIVNSLRSNPFALLSNSKDVKENVNFINQEF